MTIEMWQQVLAQFEVRGEIKPVPAENLDKYTAETGFIFPESYRTFSQVFGLGELISPLSFQIMVPGAESECSDLADFTQQWKRAVKKDSRFDHVIFFATDIATDAFYWDPLEVTDETNHEYAISMLSRELQNYRLTDSFDKLITEILMKTILPSFAGSRIDLIYRPD